MHRFRKFSCIWCVGYLWYIHSSDVRSALTSTSTWLSFRFCRRYYRFTKATCNCESNEIFHIFFFPSQLNEHKLWVALMKYFTWFASIVKKKKKKTVRAKLWHFVSAKQIKRMKSLFVSLHRFIFVDIRFSFLFTTKSTKCVGNFFFRYFRNEIFVDAFVDYRT